MKPREWSPPQGLIIQSGAILVPGRVGYVPVADSYATERFAVERRDPAIAGEPLPEGKGWHLNRRFVFAAKPTGAGVVGPELAPVSIARWDLSSLTSAELDSLQLAIDAQRQRGIGQPCPATVVDRRALERR